METSHAPEFLAQVLGDVYDTGCATPGIAALSIVEELARALGENLGYVGDLPWADYRKLVVAEIALAETLAIETAGTWSLCDDMGCETCDCDEFGDGDYVDMLLSAIFDCLEGIDLKTAVRMWVGGLGEQTRPAWMDDDTVDMLVIAIDEAWRDLEELPEPL